MYTIGQVVKLTHFSADTLRLYERRGLIEKPKRATNSYRLYSDEVIQCLHFIKRTKTMGFTLNEIKKMLDTRHYSENVCDEICQQVDAKLVVIQQKLEELHCLKEALLKLKTLNSNVGAGTCPIVEALETSAW